MRGRFHPFAPLRPAADAAKKKVKPAPEAKEEQSTLLDDTLKCAICFDLCERPITVSGRGSERQAPRAAALGGAPHTWR